jgi:hypothetical protein
VTEDVVARLEVGRDLDEPRVAVLDQSLGSPLAVLIPGTADLEEPLWQISAHCRQVGKCLLSQSPENKHGKKLTKEAGLTFSQGPLQSAR